MRQILAICMLELKRLLQKPQSYLIMFGMPIVFTLLFGNLLNNSSESKIKLMLVDEDKTVLSQAYGDQLKYETIFTVQTASLSTARKQVQDKQASGIIKIPKGFQSRIIADERTEVVFLRNPNFTTGAVVKQILANTLRNIETEVTASLSWSKYSGEPWEGMYKKIDQEVSAVPVSLQKETVANKQTQTKMSNVAERASGFSIMFVMIVMMSATGSMLEARRMGIWYRMLSAPVSRVQVLSGYLLSFFLIGWLQFGLLMLFTNWFFHVQWGNLLGLLVLVSAMLLAIIGLALLVAGLVRTVEQQSSLGNLLVVSTCMIGGVYWPLEIEPQFMQRMADFVPQTWAMRGFTELIAKGGSSIDIMSYTGILLLFAIIFFSIGLTRIRYE